MPATFDKPDPQVAVRQETKKSLVWLGVALLAVGLVLIATTWAIGTKTTETPPASSSDAKTAAKKTTTTKSGPAEGLITAVLGTGAALILVGFLFGRISSIKLPGGVEVSLAKEAEEKTLEKSVEKHPNDPAKAAAVAQKAQTLLLQENAAGGVLTDTEISAAVDNASAALS